jgi:hypothetical protein
LEVFQNCLIDAYERSKTNECHKTRKNCSLREKAKAVSIG